MLKNVELRKLPAAMLCSVVDILEINGDWKKVMSLIPKDPQSPDFEPKYNNEHIRLIESYGKDPNQKCAQILFDEWGTSGRVRPTLYTLKDLVLKAEIYRAADEIAMILQEPLPSRPNKGPPALIDTNITLLLNDESMEERLDSMGSIKTDSLNTNTLNSSHYQALCNVTTKQMKSASDLMKFDTYSENMHYTCSKSDLVSQSDLIEFSKPTVNSQEFPDFKVLMHESHVANNTNHGLSMSATTVTTESDIESSQDIPYNGHIIPEPYIPDVYQQSLPNLEIFNEVDNVILEDANLYQFEYRELESITNKFSDELRNSPSGPTGKIGSGGFGEVFVGTHLNYGSLAVKKVRKFLQYECKPEIAMKLFNTEVRSLSLLRHDNIVPILGFSIDGPSPCIVCKYIDGGSLEQKLMAKILTSDQRMNIMLGTAEGLKYIHNTAKPLQTGLAESDSAVSSKKINFLHGDVKSANILLTNDCVPKLCDFGLAKQYNSTFITKSMMGTSAYMAPEGFSGTITQKNDIFSFGVVLLELITGYRPIIINSSEDINIKNYIEENCIDNDITNFVDPVVGKWGKAQNIYNLAKQCLEHKRNERPSIDKVCDILNKIKED